MVSIQKVNFGKATNLVPVHSGVKGNHEAEDYKINGADIQHVVFNLKPGQQIRTENSDVLVAMKDVNLTTSMVKKGFFGRIGSFFKRMFIREPLFYQLYKAENKPGEVIIAPPTPGSVMVFDLSKTGNIISEKSAYFCSTGNVDTQLKWNRGLKRGFFGGEGFIMQNHTGNGKLFLSGNGQIIERELKAGEEYKVPRGQLVAYTPSVEYNAEFSGLKNTLLGSQGMFMARLTGPGKIYVQAQPIAKTVSPGVSVDVPIVIP